MGMWFFSLFSCLLIPGTMVFFGLLWKKRPPKDVNPLYGYRTSMSAEAREDDVQVLHTAAPPFLTPAIYSAG